VVFRSVITLPNTDYAHENITSNFRQARSTLPDDGSQTIQNISKDDVPTWCKQFYLDFIS